MSSTLKKQRGETHSSARLTEAQVLEIRARYAEGESLADLARAFPQCSKPNLHHIVNGRRWQFLLPRNDAETRSPLSRAA